MMKPTAGDNTGKTPDALPLSANTAKETGKKPPAKTAATTAAAPQQQAASTPPKQDDGNTPYSPSSAIEPMETDDDWSKNLQGVKKLLSSDQQPSATLKEAEVPAVSQAAANLQSAPATADPKESNTTTADTTPAATIPSEVPSDVTVKAAEYVQKAKEKIVTAIKEKLGKDNLEYETIRAKNMKDTQARNLIGDNTKEAALGDGMVATGDGRTLSGGLKFNMKNHTIISTSFKSDWTCLGCGPHGRRPAFKTRGEAGTSGPNQAVILGDQHVPAVLPATGTEQCIRILRIENGGLIDLARELVAQLGNRRFPPGSIILIFSLTHLANVGLAAYVEDLMGAKQLLQQMLGKETKVMPLPPMCLAGCNDKSVIRSIIELMSWTNKFYANNSYYLEDSFKCAATILRNSGSGTQTEVEDRRYRLPDIASGTAIWHSSLEENTELPEKIRPLTVDNERKLFAAIITELRQKMALDLDPIPTHERGIGLQARPKKKVDFLLVGSSNATRLSCALEAIGCEICLVQMANWRVQNGTTNTLIRMVREAIEQTDPGVVVFQLLDSSIYYARGTDGSMRAPKKMEDGRWHMLGTVTVCHWELQNEFFNLLAPLFDAIEKRRGLIITPMARYITGGCCPDGNHATQRDKPAYKTDMMSSLSQLSRGLKDFLFNTGRRNFKTMDPAVDLKNLQDSEIWAADPVHPKEEIYQKLAEGVVRVTNINEAKEDKKRSRADSSGENSSHQRSRLDSNSNWRESTQSRHDSNSNWREPSLNRHDANSQGRASSHYQRPQRGRGDMGRGWRGGRGFRPRGGLGRGGYY
jgi:hypothetical protein